LVLRHRGRFLERWMMLGTEKEKESESEG